MRVGAVLFNLEKVNGLPKSDRNSHPEASSRKPALLPGFGLKTFFKIC
jgi:hypothetical protein